MRDPSRRHFLSTAFAVAGTLAVSGGWGTACARPTAVPSPSLYGSGSGARVLVTYASAFGSTAEIAATIGSTLHDAGYTVDVVPLGEAPPVEDYALVVVGSPIQYDRWLDEAHAFVAASRPALAARQVAFFFSCLTLSRREGRGVAQAQGYADVLRETYADLPLVAVGQFAGVLDYGRMPRAQRLPARVVMTTLGVHAGDHRDWDAIQGWAQQVGTELAAHRAEGRRV